MNRVHIISQRQHSSGLADYIKTGLEGEGLDVQFHDFWKQRLFKLLPSIRSLRLNRDGMYRRRMVEFLYSIRAWDRNTRLNGRLLDSVWHPGDKILQVSNL